MQDHDDEQTHVDQKALPVKVRIAKNRKTDVFSAFGEWLRMQEDMNPRTIATYVSCMRTLSTIVPDYSLDAVASFTNNQKSKSVWRSAYRRFVVYMEIAHEVQMEQLKIYPMGRPTIVKRTLIAMEEGEQSYDENGNPRMPGSSDGHNYGHGYDHGHGQGAGARTGYVYGHSDDEDDIAIPEEVLDALVTLVEDGAKPEELSKLYWCHIMETGKLQHVEAPHPVLANTWLVFSRKAISTLREWAKPSTKGMSPLVPKAPGSKISYNWSILRGMIAVRKRSRQEFESS